MFSMDAGDFAGMSATLAYWFFVGAAGMGLLLWRYRGRFAGWRNLSDRDRADAVLQIGVFGILVNAAFQRGIATYSFAVQEWKLTPVTIVTAPFYLTWALVGMACILWWISLEIFGLARYRVWWSAFIATGAWLGVAVSWRF